jgi:hypothetical protein
MLAAIKRKHIIMHTRSAVVLHDNVSPCPGNVALETVGLSPPYNIDLSLCDFHIFSLPRKVQKAINSDQMKKLRPW